MPPQSTARELIVTLITTRCGALGALNGLASTCPRRNTGTALPGESFLPAFESREAAQIIIFNSIKGNLCHWKKWRQAKEGQNLPHKAFQSGRPRKGFSLTKFRRAECD